ncbi:MAG: TonB family protein [bacterium]
MKPARLSTRPFVTVLALLAGCTPAERPSERATADSVSARAIAADAPVSLALPAPGPFALERVARTRAGLAEAPPLSVEPAPAPALDPAPPEAAPAPPPDVPLEATRPPAGLQPPIARGWPAEPRGGRGGVIALDVRVDEDGTVSDVEVVTVAGDSLAVEAAVAAAFATRYHPARLDGRTVAVWARQSVRVARER